MNLMPEIARMLGVEMGEEFTAVATMQDGETTTKARLTENGLEVYDNNMHEFCLNYPWQAWLTIGKAKVKKKPWKPERYAEYWYVSGVGDVERTLFNPANGPDLMCYRLGNCYPTREAAEADKEKWVKFYASDERIEWEDKPDA